MLRMRNLLEAILKLVVITAVVACSDGATGPMGEQGEPGADGDRGARGADGEPGEDGEPGTNGTNGLNGDAGPRGEPGEDGMDGADGAVGERGPAGPSGMDGDNWSADGGSITVSSRYCTLLDGGWVFTHRVTYLADGSAFVACRVDTQSGSHSSNEVSVPTQDAGAETSCQVFADNEDDATSGYWTFETDGVTSTATYTDPGSAADGDVLTLMDCTEVP